MGEIRVVEALNYGHLWLQIRYIDQRGESTGVNMHRSAAASQLRVKGAAGRLWRSGFTGGGGGGAHRGLAAA
jgi:hypothetical protein